MIRLSGPAFTERFPDADMYDPRTGRPTREFRHYVQDAIAVATVVEGVALDSAADVIEPETPERLRPPKRYSCGMIRRKRTALDNFELGIPEPTSHYDPDNEYLGPEIIFNFNLQGEK